MERSLNRLNELHKQATRVLAYRKQREFESLRDIRYQASTSCHTTRKLSLINTNIDSGQWIVIKGRFKGLR